ALAGVGLTAAFVLAGSIDDSAGRIVVPLVTQEKDLDTRVFVTNLETRAVRVQVRYAGMQYGPAAGLKICPNLTLPPASVTTLDVTAYCGLPTNVGPGMLVLIEMDPGIARLTARARTDVRSPMSGSVPPRPPSPPAGVPTCGGRCRAVSCRRWPSAGCRCRRSTRPRTCTSWAGC